ncbi:hypothetical protein, partial [Photobacterium phosphoreum]|uniref:hypothetical protein n=1 Tax=Photobacterium phosphoreum TaxID=659 RepID=UPI00195FC1EA
NNNNNNNDTNTVFIMSLLVIIIITSTSVVMNMRVMPWIFLCFYYNFSVFSRAIINNRIRYVSIICIHTLFLIIFLRTCVSGGDFGLFSNSWVF